ncbi:hypothetical protein OAF06_02840 [Akkermansiaceae bacterium]|nr:hypothetical protein [Akkermansiaceae bacterium]MDB4667695.1 hypothetical protein [Akkermansiaceae bacterium]MDB4820170.1 hypothetical protein [Akkermansiaceae bacterium]
MKKASIITFVYLLSVSFSCALTLQELQKSFQVERLKIESEEGKKISSLRANYSKALVKIQVKYQKAGRLDDALSVKKEIDLVQEGASPFPPLEGKPPFELISARKIFSKQSITLRKVSAKDLVGLAKKMDKLLAQKVIELTKSGELEDATEARAYREKLTQDQVIVAATTLINRVRADGSSAVAMRIRRAGDNLEVDVRYDSRGKVSLESPIENVVEKTDGKEEKGKTSAKTLGEFIGAKGFEVDPYVTFSNDFTKRGSGKLGVSSLELGFVKKDADKVGVRISIPAKSVNPHGKISGVLPTLAQKGTYRVRLNYFAPKENKAVNGIQFVQGGGSPIPESISETSGAWEELEFTSVSTNEHDYLLFYLRSEKKVPLTEMKGDYITISDMSISHIAFSAYIVERFDENGAISESSPKSDQQKAMAQNGSLLTF